MFFNFLSKVAIEKFIMSLLCTCLLIKFWAKNFLKNQIFPLEFGPSLVFFISLSTHLHMQIHHYSKLERIFAYVLDLLRCYNFTAFQAWLAWLATWVALAPPTLMSFLCAYIGICIAPTWRVTLPFGAKHESKTCAASVSLRHYWCESMIHLLWSDWSGSMIGCIIGVNVINLHRHRSQNAHFLGSTVRV